MTLTVCHLGFHFCLKGRDYLCSVCFKYIIALINPRILYKPVDLSFCKTFLVSLIFHSFLLYDYSSYNLVCHLCYIV